MAKKAKTVRRRRQTTQRQPRMTKFDRLVSTTIQDHAHLSTADIARKRRVLECEQFERELKITELVAQLADVRRLKTDTDAVLFGLGAVVAGRG